MIDNYNIIPTNEIDDRFTGIHENIDDLNEKIVNNFSLKEKKLEEMYKK